MSISPLGCDEEYAPAFWLGKPCSMTEIKMPDRDYSRTGTDQHVVHTLLDGFATSRSLSYRRIWSLTYSWLFPDAYSVLMEYVTRQRGIGPFVFIDPHIKNVLTPNQASGTDATIDADGFSASGTGEELSSSSEWSQQGERALLWAFSWPVTGDGGVLHLDAPTGYHGWVSPEGESWSFSGSMRAYQDTGVIATPRLVFLSNTGSIISAVTGTSETVSDSATTDFCVTGAVPLDACYVDPQIVVSGASIDTIEYDTFSRTASNTWSPMDSGLSYTLTGTAAQFDIAAGVGTIVPNATNTIFRATAASANFGDMDMVYWVNVPVAATGNYMRFENLFRIVDANNYYAIRSHLGTTGDIEFQLIRVLAGVESTLETIISETSHVAGEAMRVRVRAVGDSIKARIWLAADEEPTTWELDTTDSNHATGAFAVAVLLPPGNTNASPVFSFDDLVVTTYPGGGLLIDELQLEMNDECTVWEYGQGQPLVSVKTDSEVVPRIRRTNITYTLVEVTP